MLLIAILAFKISLDCLNVLLFKLDELGKQLLSLASIVPDGMVVFFVSYDYLDKIVRHFKKSGVFDQLNEKKQVGNPELRDLDSESGISYGFCLDLLGAASVE